MNRDLKIEYKQPQPDKYPYKVYDNGEFDSEWSTLGEAEFRVFVLKESDSSTK